MRARETNSKAGEAMWFFGLKLKRETDIVAPVALVLALGSASFQAWVYFRGPEVQLFPPDGVTIFPSDYPTKRGPLRFETRMAYVNTAEPGYNAILRRETLTFSIAGNSYTQVWNKFVKPYTEGDKLVLDPDSPAAPLPLTAGSATSHETYFWPKQIICEQTPGTCNEWANSLDWDTLLKSLKGGVKQIQFDLVAEVYGHDNLTATCVAIG